MGPSSAAAGRKYMLLQRALGGSGQLLPWGCIVLTEQVRARSEEWT